VNTVLVVDDSELTHALVKRAFESSGYRTLHARDSAEALDLLAAQEVDALVVDIVMPNIDGVQLVQLLRSRRSADNSVPVVFYSAHADEQESRRRISEVQPATVVAKDGNVKDLVDAVANLISAHQAAAKAPAPASVILHIGKGLVAIQLHRQGQTIYELRRGTDVVLEAPTIEELMKRAQAAGLA
jgi:CheY-like chemotaxis protein